MASGDSILRQRTFEQLTLLDAVVSTDDGVWVDVGEYLHGSIHVSIATTATVQIYGADTVTRPANTTDHVQIDGDITATDLFSIAYLPRWIKAKCSSWGSGAVSVWATFRRESR